MGRHRSQIEQVESPTGQERGQSCRHWDEGDQQHNHHKACDIHGHIDCSRELEARRCHGGSGVASQNKQIRVVQINKKRDWNQTAAATAVVATAAKSPQGRPREATRSQTGRHLVFRLYTSGLSWTVTVLHMSISCGF